MTPKKWNSTVKSVDCPYCEERFFWGQTGHYCAGVDPERKIVYGPCVSKVYTGQGWIFWLSWEPIRTFPHMGIKTVDDLRKAWTLSWRK